MALQAETQARGAANATRISAEAEAEQSRISSQGASDAAIIKARAHAEAVQIKAEAHKCAEILRGEGLAESCRLHATATADGLRSVATAIEQPGGQSAMVQKLAEQYVSEMPEMAKNSKMMIVPGNPTDVSGVVATALSMTSAIKGC